MRACQFCRRSAAYQCAYVRVRFRYIRASRVGIHQKQQVGTTAAEAIAHDPAPVRGAEEHQQLKHSAHMLRISQRRRRAVDAAAARKAGR